MFLKYCKPYVIFKIKIIKDTETVLAGLLKLYYKNHNLTCLITEIQYTIKYET